MKFNFFLLIFLSLSVACKVKNCETGSSIACYNQARAENITELTKLKNDAYFFCFDVYTDHSPLDSIPDDLYCLKTVDLNISGVKETCIDTLFNKLSSCNIKEVRFFNTLDFHPPKQLTKLQSVEYLDYQKVVMNEIPKEVYDMKNLIGLYLYNFVYDKRYKSHIDTLPVALYKLKKLKVLSFINYGVKHIPRGISKMDNLEGLVITDININDKIEVDPELIKEIKSMKKLKYCRLFGVVYVDKFEKRSSDKSK